MRPPGALAQDAEWREQQQQQQEDHPMHHYLNFIDNQWVASDTSGSFEVDNPATQAIVATVSAASQAQALRACDRAAAAQRGWRRLTSVERGAHLHRLAETPLAAG